MASQVRDLHGASRSVAYLTLAATPYVIVTGFASHPTHLALAVILAVVVLLTVIGGFCWLRPHWLPEFFWVAAPLICTALIVVLNIVTDDASTGAALFYLWPVLYAANFLSRKLIYLCLTAVDGGSAVNFSVIGNPGAGADWAALLLAMTMIAVVVYTLRERADKLLHVLEDQALADPLTGLANRRSFDDQLARAGVRARRKQESLALLTIDLDHFKAINDTWGHTVGDQALQAVAQAMEAVAREEDLAARLGGDEFVMLLRADVVGARRVAEALRTAVSEVTTLPGGPPSLSIGVAVLPDDADTVEELVKASDAALYEAKSAGRDRVASLAGRGS
jgi:diguanylate cyclase (GGDEF)-like protein